MRVDTTVTTTTPATATDGASPFVVPYNTPSSGSFQTMMHSVGSTPPVASTSTMGSGATTPSLTTTTLPSGSQPTPGYGLARGTVTTGSAPVTGASTLGLGTSTPIGTSTAAGTTPGLSAASGTGTLSGVGTTPGVGAVSGANVPQPRPLPYLLSPSTGAATNASAATGIGGEAPMMQAMQAMAAAMNDMAHAMSAMEQELVQSTGSGVSGTTAASVQAAQQAYNAAATGVAASGAPVAPAAGATGATTSGGLAVGPIPLAANSGVTGTLALPVASTPTITQAFGPTDNKQEPAYDGYAHFHTGIDLATPAGTAIGAAGAGTVVQAGWDDTGFGNCVIIDHGNGMRTLYGHLSQIDVTVGQTVGPQQSIGLSGSTGNSTGPHLHFGVQQYGSWVDPAPYLGLSVAAASPGSGTSPALQSGGGQPTPRVTSGAGDLSTMIGQVAQEQGISPALLQAIVQVESAGNPRAVSSAGAKGLTQLMDTTARNYGVTDPFDPHQNLSAGAHYLHDLLNRYGGDTRLAVAAYNAGPGAVDHYSGVPPYAETQSYVARVMALSK